MRGFIDWEDIPYKPFPTERPAPHPRQILHKEEVVPGLLFRAHHKGDRPGVKLTIYKVVSEPFQGFLRAIPESWFVQVQVPAREGEENLEYEPQPRSLSDAGIMPYIGDGGVECWNPTNWWERV